MRKINGIGDGISIRRIDSDELAALAHFELAANLQILASAPLFADARLANHLHKWPRAAVENGQFQVVELDDGVINPHADERREHVLRGGNENALVHPAGNDRHPRYPPSEKG